MKILSSAITIAGILFVLIASDVRGQSTNILAAHSVAMQARIGSATQLPSGTGLQNMAGTSLPPATPLGSTLTLAEAEDRALKHQPRLMAQILLEQAKNKVIAENRSMYFPQLTGNLTAVQANGDTAQAAGAVTTSSVSTRAAGGLTLLQLVTDFGRTHDLVRSARFSAKASGQNTESVRQQILRNVDEAYFAVEAAQSVQKTAQAILVFRQVSLRQLTALAQSQLKSTLDVQFAKVLVSQAELAVVHANSTVEETRAQLTAAMGDESDPDYVLVDQPLPLLLENNVNVYIAEALQNRPDLNALKFQAKSAHQFALAEKKLNYPALNVVGTAGEVPTHDATLSHDYGAVGMNLSVPVFNGGLYTERAAEAKLRAQAEDRDVTDLTISIARDVRTAWAQAEDAFLEIQVAQRLVDQTNVAMRLAQDRYNAGLGSIVELNEAELNQTSALITAATARFDYQRTRAALNYTLGLVH